jgi:hypothetical protein
VRTGAVVWQKRFPLANALWADGRLLISDENGGLSLASVSAEGLDVHAKVDLLEHGHGPRRPWSGRACTSVIER